MAIRSHDYDSPSGRCKVSVTTEIIITWVTGNLVNMFHTDLSILSVCIRFMLSTVMYCEKYYFECILSLMKCKSNENKSKLKNKRPTWCHLLFYFTSYVLNMFRTLMYPSSGACDYSVELPHWSYCSWFNVCWSFGVVGLEWYPCCRLSLLMCSTCGH